MEVRAALLATRVCKACTAKLPATLRQGKITTLEERVCVCEQMGAYKDK